MKITESELAGLVKSLILEAPTLIGKNKIPNREPTTMEYSGEDYAVPGGSKASFIGKLRYPNDENYQGTYYLIEDEAGYEYALYVAKDVTDAYYDAGRKSWKGIPDDKYAVAITKSPKKSSITRQNPLSLNPQTKEKAYKAVRSMFDAWSDKYDAGAAAKGKAEKKKKMSKAIRNIAKAFDIEQASVYHILNKMTSLQLKEAMKEIMDVYGSNYVETGGGLEPLKKPSRYTGDMTLMQYRDFLWKLGMRGRRGLPVEYYEDEEQKEELEKLALVLSKHIEGVRKARKEYASMNETNTKVKITKSQLNKIITEMVESTTVTSQQVQNVELRIMNWTAKSRMGANHKAETAKKVKKWKEKNADIYDGLKDDLKKKIDKLESGA